MADPSTQRKLEITLLQERSSGTFARVHMARARAPDGLTRIVAVKVLREKWANTEEVLTRTRDEAQLLARLQHPNILRVEAITEVQGQPAIVMEFVHGADLGQIIKHLKERDEHFPFRTVYEVAERVTGALAAAYYKVPVSMRDPLRVVHRDIKPSNIMISGEGALKMLDFGTARFEDAERAAKTEAIRFGSIKYMSSERREGDRGDHSSDIYATGLVLLELLHGSTLPTLPMERADHDLQVHRRLEVLTDLGLPNEGWDTSLRQTLSRMLAYDANQRLDARQCVKLFRAFKEQAAGDSLSAFAEQVVGPMAGNIFAAPDDGQMSGARFELDNPTADFSSLEPEPPTETASATIKAPPPLTQLETQEMPRPTQPRDNPLKGSTMDMYPANPRPGYAFGNLDEESVEALPTPQDSVPFHDPEKTDGGGRAKKTADNQFHTQETTTSSIPPPRSGDETLSVITLKTSSERTEGTPRSMWAYAAVGCAMVSLLVGIGFVLAWTAMNSVEPPSSAAAQSDNPSLDIVAGASHGAATVKLAAGDPTVQWLKLVDGKGSPVVRARPDGEASVPVGDYTLRVKVVARPVLETSVSINEDTTLRCKPATMGRVRCINAAGVTAVVLQP